MERVSLPETVGQAVQALTSNGKIDLILLPDKSRSDVLMCTPTERIALTSRYSGFDHDLNVGPQHVTGCQGDHKFATEVYDLMYRAACSGKLKPNP